MDPKKKGLVGLASGVCITLALGGLLYSQHSTVLALREKSVQMDADIAGNRKLLSRTPDIERDVILQRETDEVVRTILPNAKDMPNFTRALHAFAQEAQVRISSLQEKNTARGPKANKTDFEKAAYTLQFEGDAFQLLAFFNLVETSQQFMSIPAFQLSAAKRRRMDEESGPQSHAVTMEVETYVYDETGRPDRVQVEGYERKRDQMMGDIAKRTNDLILPKYAYKGSRNRRDPWIDPRILANDETTTIPITEQIALVDGLVQHAVQAALITSEFEAAQTVVAQIKSRRDLETKLATLEIEVRRVESEAYLSYEPAKRRFQIEVVDEIARIREVLDVIDKRSPSREFLEKTAEAMEVHLSADEFDLALQAYQTVQPRLAQVVPGEPLIDELVEQVEFYAELARKVIKFNRLGLKINGLSVIEGRFIALIDGKSKAVGDMVGPDLQVLSISYEFVEFLFEGIAVRQAIGN